MAQIGPIPRKRRTRQHVLADQSVTDVERTMKNVTYGRLHEVLRALGFSVRVVTTEKKLRVYEHEATGALLALAFLPEGEGVLPHHLAAVQGTLKVYGIADPLDFAAALQKAG